MLARACDRDKASFWQMGLDGNRGNRSLSGWTYDHGKGRVVFIAVGHINHAMWNPQYLELQKRAVRWLLKNL